MNISQAGLDLIVSFEGYHRKLANGDCTTYRCPANVLTIGFGCTEGIREGEVWTRQQAEKALMRELAKFEAAVTRLVTVEINQNQYDALVSFAYNCGEGALGKSTLLRKLNAGDFDGAANAFAMWTKGGGRVLPGLVRRRAAEAALFRKPAEPAEEPDMPQGVDIPSPREEHEDAAGELKSESWFYSVKRWLLKKLGLPVAGSTVGIASLDDPVSTLSSAMMFAKAYGLVIVAGAVALIFAVEVMQYMQRQKALGGR